MAKYVDAVLVEKYLWSGHNMGLLAVYNASDVLQMRFEYAGGRLPVVIEKLNGETFDRYYLHYDQVGSLRVVTDAAGTVVKTIEYDSFGNITAHSGSLNVPIGFAGGFYDADTDLVLFGYRDYDPSIGRWLARDPIGFQGGDSNLWVYCKNDPVGLYDITGKNPGAAVAVFVYWLAGLITEMGLAEVGICVSGTVVVSGISNTQIIANLSKLLPKIEGMTTAQMGELLGWGKKEAGALLNMADLTKDKCLAILDSGWTVDMLTAWRDHFVAAAALLENDVSAARVEFLEEILRILEDIT